MYTEEEYPLLLTSIFSYSISLASIKVTVVRYALNMLTKWPLYQIFLQGSNTSRTQLHLAQLKHPS